MNDQRKTKDQLLVELAALRQRVTDLEHHVSAPETGPQSDGETLLASQQNLAALIENTDGSIWSVDAHYRLIVANELYQRNVSAALGRKLLPGESVLQPAFPPAALAEWQSYYDRALHGEHFSIKRHTRFARQSRYIEYRFSPITLADGTRGGVTVFGRDITEAQQAEEQLRASEEKYRLLVDTANEGIWAMDREHRTTYVNHAMAAMLGYTPAEMLGRPVEDFFFAEDLAFHGERMQRRHAGQDETYERRFRRRDGSSLWTLVSARATMDAAGEFSGSFAMFTDITARKQAEAAVRESEERLRSFVQYAPIGLGVLDRDFRYLALNDTLAEFNDLPVAAHLGQPLAVIKPTVAQKLEPLLRQILATGQPLLNIDQLKPATADGHAARYFVTSIFPILDTHGAISALGLAVVDVTDRRQIEETLAQSEARYRGIFNGVQDAIFVEAPDGTIVDVNQPACAMFGYSREEFIGKHVRDIVPKPATIVSVSQLEAGPPGQTIETINVRATGEQFPVELRGSTLEFGDQKLLLAVVRDITERKLAEEALQAGEERFRTMVDFTYDWEYWIGPDRQIIYMSPSCERVTGYGAAEVQANVALLEQMIHPDDRALVQHHFQAEFTGAQVSHLDFRIVTRRGDICWISHVCQAVHGAQGRWLGRRVSNRDITDRKRAEAATLQLNAELEMRVAARTQELAAMVDRLRDLDRLKSKFVSDVSHELRTPVTSLALYIDLLECGKPDKYGQYVSKLKEQMARLHRLINDILDMSRLERARDDGDRSAVDLNSIAEHVCALERGAAEAAGLVLTYDVTEGLPAVVARPDQLTRAITNLVSNAIKYTPRGTIRVQTGQQGQRVFVAVSDTGRGIPADEMPHLFERFYRGRDVAQSTIPGTGLGLSIVKEIIEVHGGTVEVESQLGQGSTFRVWLPVG